MRENVLSVYVDEARPGAEEATVVPLHGARSTHLELLPLARSLGGGLRIVAPKSARFAGFSAEGSRYSWFTMPAVPRPDPIAFGDALWQLETFLWHVVLGDREMREPRRRIVLLGHEQGAALGLVMAVVWPELFHAVIALRGFWPVIPGWSLPRVPRGAPPVLLATDPRDPAIPTSLADEAAVELERLGVPAQRLEIEGAAGLDEEALVPPLRRWLGAVAQGAFTSDTRGRTLV